MASKKYYWLKLKKDFFKRHDIRIIEEMPNGKDYILFYMKLLLESVDHEGMLRFSETIPYNEQMLAVVTNTNIDIVKSAMQVFTSLNMVDVLDDETIYMAETEKMIGSATDDEQREQWRIRQQRYREKQKLEMRDVTNTSRDNNVKTSLEKDIEKDIEKEKNISIDYKFIVDYLNMKTGRAFKVNVKKTQTLIKARFNEGFTEQDFIDVIDKKTKQWKGTEMDKYLRPETLFGTKFEGYLNESDKVTSRTNHNKFVNFQQRDYDFDAIQNELIRVSMDTK